MRRERCLPAVLIFLLAGCASEPSPLLGSLEWDRIAITAEASEPVLHWSVAEGDLVEAGAALLQLDPRRADARIERATGDLRQAEARLSELANGARLETIEAARAEVASAQAAQAEAEREYVRVAEMRERGLVAVAALDAVTATRNQRRAATTAASAQLRELTRGTRPEQVEQAAAAVESARAALRASELDRARLDIVAPRAGRIDALPFKPGDQPPIGAAVVSLLVGEAPFARIFVPAPQRTDIEPGATFRVRVQGIDEPFDANVRSIRSEPSFTPYYALAGDDASRLVYRAELVLQGDAARKLPAGLPVTVGIASDDRK
jgi:HlyD family secretion protein